MIKVKLKITPEIRQLIEKHSKDMEFALEEYILQRAAEIRASWYLMNAEMMQRSSYIYLMTQWLDRIEQGASDE